MLIPLLLALFAAPPLGGSPPKSGVQTPYSDSQWKPMPLVTQKMLNAGFIGGEGAQVLRTLTLAPSDPNFMLAGIDVGGLYRTLDGGKRWEPANVGWNARGCNFLIVDPRNSSRVYGVAGNSMDWSVNGVGVHGVYRSTDKAASWRQVLPLTDGFDGSIAVDPASYDNKLGYCPLVYFASKSLGVWKSLDGGDHWQQAYPNLNNLRLKMHPNGKTLYAWGMTPEGQGFYRSDDGAKTFTKLSDAPVFGLDVCPKEPNSVWTSGVGGIKKSLDGGNTFAPLPVVFPADAPPADAPVEGVSVSPAAPNHLSVWWNGPNWHLVRYATTDGENLFISQFEGTDATGNRVFTGNNFLPYNVRTVIAVYHPTIPDLVYGTGGDWMTRSTDGGRNCNWWANGYNGIMVGTSFNFSPDTPNTVFLSAQDYNAAFTRDGGKTWNYRDVSGNGWGGFCYGGYTPDGKLMFFGNAASWGAHRTLRMSDDGGTTWRNAVTADGKECVFAGSDFGYSVPGNPQIAFASNFRTTDHGKTWSAMPGCDGVYTRGNGIELYGKKGNAVVVSRDSGATWSKVGADCPGGFGDLAVDPKTGRIYVASEDRLKVSVGGGSWTVIETPTDQYASNRVRSVAVDPQFPNIVVIGSAKDVYTSHAAVCRSTDSGTTWRNLTTTIRLGKMIGDSPHEVDIVRIHPITREIWVNGECYGMWRHAPPAPNERGVSAQEASAPLAPTVTLPSFTRAIIVKNGGMEDGDPAPTFWDSRWTGRGKLDVLRDTTMPHGSKSSLLLKSTGDSQGQVAQVIEAPAGTKFTLSGFLKTSGSARVNVAIQPYDGNWGPISFLQIGYAQNNTDWFSFSKAVSLPTGTVRFGVVLLLEGDGSAWLDDVSLTVTP